MFSEILPCSLPVPGQNSSGRSEVLVKKHRDSREVMQALDFFQRISYLRSSMRYGS